MTQVRLEEILSKDNVSNEELGEILGDMFLSFSKHFKAVSYTHLTLPTILLV